MSKLSVTLLFIGVSLVVVCDGSPVSSESSESSESRETNVVQKILNNVREQCIQNTGSDAAFDGFMLSYQMAWMCVADFDTENFKIDYGLLTNATREAFFSKYCPKGRTLASCLAGSLKVMQPCVEVAAFEMGDVLLRTIPQALDLACHNDGEIVFKLKDEQRKECMAQKADEISTCFNMLGNTGQYVIDFTELTQEQCSALTNVRQCMKDILKSCDLADIVNVYEIPIRAVLPLTPCVNQTEQQNVNLHENNSIVEISGA
uniref:Putative secreted protein n=1 Tax=Anopheles marajoara TaxID=58244 RepID=A0A2M4BY19_9DIPT